jgi:glutathione synthase
LKLAFAINELSTERSGYTTTHLALRALRRGHQVWYVEVGDFALAPDGRLDAYARRFPVDRINDVGELIAALNATVREKTDLSGLDALFLRNDPAPDALTRPWAQLAGVNFGRLAQQAGVVVVNSPDGLYHAINKLYLQMFPAEIRPKTLISRDIDAIRDFIDAVGGAAVLKPLRGSGGHNVFLIRPDDKYNFKQILETVRGEGYVIAQEFLPEAEKGDTRLFLLEGEILEVDGEVAAVRRIPASGDLRSNITAGGRVERAVTTDRMRHIADLARNQLRADDMFLVGVDLIGDKMVEVNVFSPGALHAAERVTGADFMTPVIEALERRVIAARNKSGSGQQSS